MLNRVSGFIKNEHGIFNWQFYKISSLQLAITFYLAFHLPSIIFFQFLAISRSEKLNSVISGETKATGPPVSLGFISKFNFFILIL